MAARAVARPSKPGRAEVRAAKAISSLECAHPWDSALIEFAVAVARALDGRKLAADLASAVSDASAAIALAREGAPGPVAAAVERELGELRTDHPTQQALTQSAITLAAALDAGGGNATAAFARELRATLEELANHKAGNDDDDIEGDLSTPDGPTVPAAVGNAASPRPSDSRAGGRKGSRSTR